MSFVPFRKILLFSLESYILYILMNELLATYVYVRKVEYFLTDLHVYYLYSNKMCVQGTVY